MSYTTVAEVKRYLDITGTSDDALLASLITSAQAAIDAHCDRTFEAVTDSTRYFDGLGPHIDGVTLWLDRDLCSITTVTNGDGNTISGSSYVTWPRNSADGPFYAIRIKESADTDWTYGTDWENAISIAGRWAYSTSAPDDVRHACTRLAGFYYRQKDAQVFDVTAIPDAGVMTVPVGIPADVKLMLNPYRRRAG